MPYESTLINNRSSVTIIITLAANDVPLTERPLLLSMGMAEQLPVVKTGAFANLMSLIEEAWTALGIRAQMAGAAIEEETIAEAQTAAPNTMATADTDNYETSPPAPNPLSAPQPRAKNLSLFQDKDHDNPDGSTTVNRG